MQRVIVQGIDVNVDNEMLQDWEVGINLGIATSPLPDEPDKKAKENEQVAYYQECAKHGIAMENVMKSLLGELQYKEVLTTLRKTHKPLTGEVIGKWFTELLTSIKDREKKNK